MERLARAVPVKVREVCATLTAAGYQAVVVGGCVRDTLMDREPSDWDIASSALPDEVLKLFRHTVETGLQHGTIMVLMGRGQDEQVEITTYRGEGAYSDARRPDAVEFGVPLTRDLERRDLTVNAIAYDPARNEIIDPFGGQADIANRRLRAVGNAVDRFTEDGLRVMRAVRFAAQLEFDLDPDTEAGIAPALPSLARVSRERVCVELRKTLEAREPSRGLWPAVRTGIIASVLPELAIETVNVKTWVARIDRAARPVRLAAMLHPLASEGAPRQHLDRATAKRAQSILHALKFSNVEAELAAQLLGVVQASGFSDWGAAAVRQLLSELARDKRAHAIELWEADEPRNEGLIALARATLAEGHPLAIGDLAISGKDLMAALGMPAGPAIGRVLAQLLERVLDDPAKNTREVLLAEAQKLELELGR